MSDVLNGEGLDLVFRKARSHSAWLDKPVDDGLLRQVYDLAKMGPTSANMSPMRIVFVKSPEAKERLRPALDAGNVDKTMSAPVTAVLGMDVHFYEKLPKLFPHADAKSWFQNLAEQVLEYVALRNSSHIAAVPSALSVSSRPSPVSFRGRISCWPPGRWDSTAVRCRASTTPKWTRCSLPGQR